MHHPGRRCLIFLLTWGAHFASAVPAASEECLRAVEGFDSARIGGPNGEAISHWRWTPEEKRDAKKFSRLEVAESESSGHVLKVTIVKPLPGGADFYRVWLTALDYLPPEATALRLRVRVVSGTFALTAGSATAYFANSDVWARPQVLEAGGWQTIEFSLVSDLQRNFRRAIFSAESPVIHYTRWIQEPLQIMVGAGSQGELWIDDIGLVLAGESRGLPAWEERPAHPLAVADLGGAFTFSTDDKEFDLARTPGKEAVRKPAVLKRPAGEGEPLEASQRGLEEMSFIGIPISCPDGANAFRVTMKTSQASRLDELVVDFLALVSCDGIFPWTKAGEGAGFDLCLSPAATKGVSWGFYHARRIVPNGAEVVLVIPFEDFVCAHGSGALRERHLSQQALRAGEVVAVAMVSPFRQSGAETHFTILSLEAVRLEE